VQRFTTREEVLAAAGSNLGSSGWHTVNEDRIDAFADTVDDHQWIHLDRERASVDPSNSRVVHGFLTLALIPSMLRQVYTVEAASVTINYGLERVRFPVPLAAGSEVRVHAVLKTATVESDRVRVVTAVSVEERGKSKPCCVAEWVTLLYF